MKDSKLNKFIYLINGIIAYIIFKITPKFKKQKKFWLIGGHLGKIYDDNSKTFFEYVINRSEKEIYWVLNKNSIAETQIPYKNKVLYRGSIKAYLYCYSAECIIVSHCLADVMPIFYKIKNRFKFINVYLEHGILGFKKVYNDENYYSQFDIVCTVSEFEKKIKEDNFKIEKNKLKITGLTRYDNLEIDNTGNGNIFVMFTWREYDDKTEYINKVIDFLTNSRLRNVLEKNDVTMYIALHSFMHDYYNEINIKSSKNIIILPKDVNIQRQLIDNSLLITDYSSVSWDFAYMKKPVIFYQFDLEEYLRQRGSYIDLKGNLFGPRSIYEKEVINLIENYIETGKLNYNSEIDKVEKYFKYNDNNNCKRLFTEIIKILKEKSNLGEI